MEEDIVVVENFGGGRVVFREIVRYIYGVKKL